MEQYIVSARKYRPATFDMVVGQRALTTTLLNAIRTGKLAHAYLFCGPRGVGKTTCARIFAKTINCTQPGESGEPCNQCESCRAFEEQRSLNIHELDAASNNSVDDIRELIDQVRIPPQAGRYKVFIIDEVHMLSQQAFNAFLKTLEEPPKYVIFILATTEKHKILPTILSRCQVYDFARITVQSTVDHLKYVAQKEGYTVEDEALNLIAQKADGGMRDALSIFDQMVSFTQGNVTYQSTLESLNILDADYYFRLVDNMLNRDIQSALLLFNEVLGKGFDGGNFIAGLASHFRNLLVSRDAKTLPLLEVSEAQRERYHEQAMRCKPQFLYRAIRLCNDCDLGYRQSRNKRLQVELCLIQTAQATDDEGDGAGRCPAKKLKPLFTQAVAQGAAGTAPQPSAARQPESAPAAQPATPVSPTAAVGQPVAQQSTTPQAMPKLRTLNLSARSIHRTPKAGQAATPTADKAKSPGLDIPKVPANDVPRRLDNEALNQWWVEFANSLPQEETATAQRMKSMTPVLLPGANAFFVTVANVLVEKAILKHKPRIEAYLQEVFTVPELRLRIEVTPYESNPMVYDKREHFRRMIQRHTPFRMLYEEFGLELD